MTVRCVLDCDTGSDDAIAILAAIGHPDVELLGITTVNGNVALEHVTENTLRALDLVGAAVPVHPGATRPLVRPDFPIPRAILNGDTEFQRDLLDLPRAVSRPASTSAVSFLVDTYRDEANADVTLVATGPLTNIAVALAAEPRLVERIPRLVVMGGACGNGNVTAAAEFNLWVDPEAAEAVFGAGLREVVVFGLDATHSAPLTAADCAAFDDLGTPAARAAAGLIRHRLAHDRAAVGAAASPVHDPMCVAYLVRPDLVADSVTAHVSVETTGTRTLGELVVDTRPWCPRPANARVVLRADGAVYREFLGTALAGA